MFSYASERLVDTITRVPFKDHLMKVFRVNKTQPFLEGSAIVEHDDEFLFATRAEAEAALAEVQLYRLRMQMGNLLEEVTKTFIGCAAQLTPAEHALREALVTYTEAVRVDSLDTPSLLAATKRADLGVMGQLQAAKAMTAQGAAQLAGMPNAYHNIPPRILMGTDAPEMPIGF